MAHDRKYGQITAEHGDRVHGKTGVPLNKSDEPVFLLRAQDAASLQTLASYRDYSDLCGAPDEHLATLADVVRDFEQWQADNPSLVKAPD